MIEKKDTNDAMETTQSIGSSKNWEREILEKLVMSTVTEKRKARHWNILFKSLFLIYLVAIAFLLKI